MHIRESQSQHALSLDFYLTICSPIGPEVVLRLDPLNICEASLSSKVHGSNYSPLLPPSALFSLVHFTGAHQASTSSRPFPFLHFVRSDQRCIKTEPHVKAAKLVILQISNVT